MPSFKFYSGALDSILRFARDPVTGCKPKPEKGDHFGAFKAVLAKGGDFFRKSLDYQVSVMEAAYMREQSQAYIIKDTKSFNEVNKVKVGEVDFAALLEPGEVFTIAFPEETGFPGMLVNTFGLDDFKRWTKYLIPDSLVALPEGVTDPQVMVSMCFSLPDEVEPKFNCTYQIVIPTSRLTEMLGEEGIENLRALKTLEYHGAQEVGEEETVRQKELLTFLARFLLYRAAMPERFSENLPDRYSNSNPMYKKAKRHRMVSFNITEHWRSPTLRHLVAARYYKGKYADLKPGSRVVAVPGCVVNRRAKEIVGVD